MKIGNKFDINFLFLINKTGLFANTKRKRKKKHPYNNFNKTTYTIPNRSVEMVSYFPM